MGDDNLPTYSQGLIAKMRELIRPGVVLQLHPTLTRTKAFSACFFVVTERKAFGAMGFVMPIGEELDKHPSGQCYYRAMWGELCTHTEAEWKIVSREEQGMRSTPLAAVGLAVYLPADAVQA